MEVKPGYKQTQVGVIPVEWHVGRLSSLLEPPRSVRYGIVQPGQFVQSGCLMLRSQDYSKGWTQPDEMHRVSGELENQYRNARIRRGDLIMTVVGAGIGQVVVAPDWLDGAILSRSTARIAVDENRASRDFVRASLESPVGQRQILDCQKEGAQPVVSCQDLAKFFLPCPPPPEQRAIAEALSDVDGLLGGLDRLIAKKRDLKQAAMQQLLTGQTRLPGFIGDWEVKKLGEVAQIEKGQLITSSTLAPGDIPVIAGGKQPAYFHASANRFGRTITISASGASAGYVARYDGPIFASDCSTISESESYCLDFVYYLLLSKQQTIYMAQTGGAQPHIHAKDLNPIPVFVPPVPEQTAIAEVLTEMDEELAALKQRQEKTRALKQAMMQDLLTGRTRLLNK